VRRHVEEKTRRQNWSDFHEKEMKIILMSFQRNRAVIDLPRAYTIKTLQIFTNFYHFTVTIFTIKPLPFTNFYNLAVKMSIYTNLTDFYRKRRILYKRRHDTQHNDTQSNGIWHFILLYYMSLCWVSVCWVSNKPIMLSVAMLSVVYAVSFLCWVSQTGLLCLV
jgi:hypothetical protein